MNKCDIYGYFGPKLSTRDIIEFQKLLNDKLYSRKMTFCDFGIIYCSCPYMAKGHIRICGKMVIFTVTVFCCIRCIVYDVIAAKCRLDLSSSSTGSKVRNQLISSSHDPIWKTNAHIVKFGDRTIFSIIGYSNSIIYLLNPSRYNL